MTVTAAAVAVLTTAAVLGGQAGAAAAPAREQVQSIDWHDCAEGDDLVGQALDGAGAECAEVTVPLDYSRPDGPTLEVAVSRIEATDDENRRGALLINPGGPGGSGLHMPLLIGAAAPAVAARYDLIGMDPRFVGRSTPLDCKWPISVSLRGAGPNRQSFVRHAAWAKNLATSCADQKDVLPHASTRNTARDMNEIRAALDVEKLSYLGYSYGTFLGAVYLQLFPGRADRVVFDSNVDPNVYGPNLFARSGPAMTAALKNWAAWTARRNGTYQLGATTAQVLASVELIRKATDRGPLTVGAYQVDAHLLPMLLRVPDDSPEIYVEEAAAVRVLRDAARGARVTPTQALAEVLAYVNSPVDSAVASSQTAILCADRAVSRNPATYLQNIERHRKAEPLYGPLIHNVGPCAFWPTSPAEATARIGNAVPVLMLNATGDTQTPYSGAKVMQKALRGSRLVTLGGAYRHGVYLIGRSDCADRTVERYLLDGVLPRTDVTCSTDRTTSPGGGLSSSLGLTPLS